MKHLTCPLNGSRPIDEFVYGGEVRAMPDPETRSDEAWTDYLFARANAAGVVAEWWFHAPSGFWFIAERDTVSDRVLRTYEASEAPDLQRREATPS